MHSHSRSVEKLGKELENSLSPLRNSVILTRRRAAIIASHSQQPVGTSSAATSGVGPIRQKSRKRRRSRSVLAFHAENEPPTLRCCLSANSNFSPTSLSMVSPDAANDAASAFSLRTHSPLVSSVPLAFVQPAVLSPTENSRIHSLPLGSSAGQADSFTLPSHVNDNEGSFDGSQNNQQSSFAGVSSSQFPALCCVAGSHSRTCQLGHQACLHVPFEDNVVEAAVVSNPSPDFVMQPVISNCSETFPAEVPVLSATTTIRSHALDMHSQAQLAASLGGSAESAPSVRGSHNRNYSSFASASASTGTRSHINNAASAQTGYIEQSSTAYPNSEAQAHSVRNYRESVNDLPNRSQHPQAPFYTGSYGFSPQHNHHHHPHMMNQHGRGFYVPFNANAFQDHHTAYNAYGLPGFVLPFAAPVLLNHSLQAAPGLQYSSAHVPLLGYNPGRSLSSWYSNQSHNHHHVQQHSIAPQLIGVPYQSSEMVSHGSIEMLLGSLMSMRHAMQHLETSLAQVEDRLHRHPRGLNRTEINRMPAWRWRPSERPHENDQTSCVVCMSDFEERQLVRALPCRHIFHSRCVDRWLKTNRSCPICRSEASPIVST